ncbi:alpha/beta fold hydrolase [Trinickia mobilis]|uniref:alpha/beta fold hydrolase n=1 Tax=Trinickia mobilis TaxID=2816356 RepID=UPI001A8E1A76|nr:alpha/beta fold hydrolase [Trinickia mobilis]
MSKAYAEDVFPDLGPVETLPDRFGARDYVAGLAYRSVGSGPVLFLIHGGSGSRNHWLRNVEALSRHFLVVTIDLPGFGESGSPPVKIETSEYLDWVADSVGLVLETDSAFHIAGFSFGGAVAAATAAALWRRGYNLQRLTLVSPAGFGRPTGRDIELEKVFKGPDTTQEEVRAATARNLGRWMLNKTPSPDATAVDIHLWNVANARYDSRRISHLDTVIGDIRSVGVPVQVMLGASDPLIFPSFDERRARLSEALPGIHIETVTGAGHWLPYEASDIVNRCLIQFHLKGDDNVF